VSEFGRQVAVDLEADANLNQRRCRPGHDFLLDLCEAIMPLQRAFRIKLVQVERMRNAVDSI
jgi:hypothetical protein